MNRDRRLLLAGCRSDRVAGGDQDRMGHTRDRLMRMGQIAELRFWVEALRRGVIVAKPHEGARYDFLVDCGRRIFRVQVKSTSAKVQRCYRVNAFGGSGIRYTGGEVDILAAYIIPEKEWWIIPLRALHGAGSAVLTRGGRLARYREAWHLLLDQRKQARVEINAAADVNAIDARTATEEELLAVLRTNGWSRWPKSVV